MSAGEKTGEHLKVWLVQHGEPFPTLSSETSMRTARLSKELASRGHDVTYWCSSFWHHKKELYCRENREEEVHGYTLRILHAGEYKSNSSFARYVHHRKMAKALAKEARAREKPDIIVAGMPIHYCAYECVKFGREVGVPVIVDIRDYWPDIFLTMFPKWLRWVGRVIFRSDFDVTRVALRDASALTSMMRPLLEWGAKEYAGRELTDDDRVFFIGGDEPASCEHPSALEVFPELTDRLDGRFVVNYIGGFGAMNHPMVLVEAAKYLQGSGNGDRILFLIGGKGDYYNRCIRAAEGLDNVVFLGWLDVGGIAALNSISSAGVIPSIEDFSFPNKAFSYLASGLPVFCSEQGDLRELILEYEAGFYFDISDPAQLADGIVKLSQFGERTYRKISENCNRLFREHLRADNIYRRYADYVERMATKHHTRVGNSQGMVL